MKINLKLLISKKEQFIIAGKTEKAAELEALILACKKSSKISNRILERKAKNATADKIA